MINIKKIFLFSFITIIMSSCGMTNSDLGFEKTSPDEMLVVSRAPLSIPPEFGLRPVIVDTVSSEDVELTTGEQDLLSQMN